MADEMIVNGVASDGDDQMVEDDRMLKREPVLDLGKDVEVSELNKKIEALEQEKAGLMQENEGSNEKIKLLMDEIEGFKRNQAEMKERLDKMQREINRSEEDKKALEVISARAAELERQVSLLQHDLILSVTESEETSAELRDLKNAFEGLKESNRENESKVEELKNEKASLLTRINQLQIELDESKKMVSDLKQMSLLINGEESNKNTENDLKSLKIQWPMALASTGAVVAATAIFYISYTRRR